jgi:hypothetical protein
MSPSWKSEQLLDYLLAVPDWYSEILFTQLRARRRAALLNRLDIECLLFLSESRRVTPLGWMGEKKLIALYDALTRKTHSLAKTIWAAIKKRKPLASKCVAFLALDSLKSRVESELPRILAGQLSLRQLVHLYKILGFAVRALFDFLLMARLTRHSIKQRHLRRSGRQSRTSQHPSPSRRSNSIPSSVSKLRNKAKK